ncbi:hypothetical protein Ancab_027314 [Ancistrocladus abbreviatus]
MQRRCEGASPLGDLFESRKLKKLRNRTLEVEAEGASNLGGKNTLARVQQLSHFDQAADRVHEWRPQGFTGSAVLCQIIKWNYRVKARSAWNAPGCSLLHNAAMDGRAGAAQTSSHYCVQ